MTINDDLHLHDVQSIWYTYSAMFSKAEYNTKFKAWNGAIGAKAIKSWQLQTEHFLLIIIDIIRIIPIFRIAFKHLLRNCSYFVDLFFINIFVIPVDFEASRNHRYNLVSHWKLRSEIFFFNKINIFSTVQLCIAISNMYVCGIMLHTSFKVKKSTLRNNQMFCNKVESQSLNMNTHWLFCFSIYTWFWPQIWMQSHKKYIFNGILRIGFLFLLVDAFFVYTIYGISLFALKLCDFCCRCCCFTLLHFTFKIQVHVINTADHNQSNTIFFFIFFNFLGRSFKLFHFNWFLQYNYIHF